MLELLRVVLEFLQLLVDVCIGREVDMQNDPEVVERCVPLVQRDTCIATFGAWGHRLHLIEGLRRGDGLNPSVLVELSHLHRICLVHRLLLGAVAEQVAEKVRILLENEDIHDRVRLGLRDDCLVVRQPCHGIW